MSTGILSKLKLGQVPLEVRRSAARGVLPVGQEELLAILIFLRQDPEPEVSAKARETISSEFSDSLLITIAASHSAPVEVLEYLGSPPFRNEQVIEALIQNKTTPDSTIASLGEQVEPSQIEVILINLMRLLRSPFILEALEQNPKATPDIRRKLAEIREEFFEKRNTFIPIHRTAGEAREMAEVEAEPETAIVVYSETAEEGQDITSLTLRSLADDGYDSFEEMGEVERMSTIQRVARMTVAERVQTALKGSREERVILVRDSNRLVASAVLDSPKLTDSEVEGIALMRNVSQEVLRTLGTKRELTKSYSVIHNLVKNPRTPVPISLTLLNRILLTDIKSLARNKNVPEVVRRTASRQVQMRSQGRRSK